MDITEHIYGSVSEIVISTINSLESQHLKIFFNLSFPWVQFCSIAL